MAETKTPPASTWTPFKYRAFALLWTATLVSNVGTWMHDVGAGWLMTSLSPSPAVVSLVQAATTLPIFCFALLAGAVADRVDKRTFLIRINAVLAVVVAAMAGVTAAGWMTPAGLLLFTFLIGTGVAFMAPAWQAVVPSLVPREALQPAIALNSVGINISRAIGPAVAGVLITVVGLAAPFIFNAASYAIILLALFFWKPPAVEKSALPPEPILGAMLTGLRHVRWNAPLKATLVRSFGFFIFASGFWALLPLIARDLPGGGSEIYGFLLASIGAGAVIGALTLPKFRDKMDANMLTAAGTGITALAMAMMALVTDARVVVVAAFLAGLGWITVLTNLNVSAQTSLPNWLRARGLAIALMVFFGCMSAGSVLWGQVATYTSIPTALMIAAAGLVAAVPLTWRAKLAQGAELDLSPALDWAPPVVASDFDADPDRGPVMITIEYTIDPTDQSAFLRALHALSAERYRDGAVQWGVFEDTEQAGRWIEYFIVPSWAEHLRQHERATKHDADLHADARAFHRGEAPPVVRHLLAPKNG